MKRRFCQAAHCIVATKVDKVRESALAAGGTVSWVFSQVQNPVRSLITTDDDTAIGICEMLAAKWIECHAKDGHIANWLTPNNRIDLARVREVMGWFKVGMQAASQTQETIKWLASNKIMQRYSFTQPTAADLKLVGKTREQLGYGLQVPTAGTRGAHKRRVLAHELGTIIAGTALNAKGMAKDFSWGYHKLIGIQGPHFAHACASFAQRDVAYFDPNFGEFWFEKRDDFVRWFPTYWDKAGYGTPQIGLSESYEIRDFWHK